MPRVRPANAKKAIETFGAFLLGAIDTFDAMEQGVPPVQAVVGAVKSYTKKKKKAKKAKKALKKQKRIEVVSRVVDAEIVEERKQ